MHMLSFCIGFNVTPNKFSTQIQPPLRTRCEVRGMFFVHEIEYPPRRRCWATRSAKDGSVGEYVTSLGANKDRHKLDSFKVRAFDRMPSDLLLDEWHVVPSACSRPPWRSTSFGALAFWEMRFGIILKRSGANTTGKVR
jgi:hypothetical protein